MSNDKDKNKVKGVRLSVTQSGRKGTVISLSLVSAGLVKPPNNTFAPSRF